MKYKHGNQIKVAIRMPNDGFEHWIRFKEICQEKDLMMKDVLTILIQGFIDSGVRTCGVAGLAPCRGVQKKARINRDLWNKLKLRTGNKMSAIVNYLVKEWVRAYEQKTEK